MYEHIYVDCRKTVQMNLSPGQNRHTDVENKHMDAKEGKGGWDELGD